MLLALILLSVGAALTGLYGHVLRKHALVKQAQTQLDALLAQRAELLPEFAERMHTHWPQECQPLMRLQELAQRSTHGPHNDRTRADQAISKLLKELLELAKQTPNLTAAQPLQRLEHELQVARERCQEAMESLGATTNTFPTSAVAAQLGVSQHGWNKRKPSG